MTPPRRRVQGPGSKGQEAEGDAEESETGRRKTREKKKRRLVLTKEMELLDHEANHKHVLNDS